MSELHHSQRWTKLSAKVKRKSNGFCANPFGLHTNPKALGGQVLTYCDCVHHIKPVEDYPDEVYNESNCIALCKRCHEFAHRLYNSDEQRYFKILIDTSKKTYRDSSKIEKKRDKTDEELLKNTQRVFVGVGVKIENGILKL